MADLDSRGLRLNEGTFNLVQMTSKMAQVPSGSLLRHALPFRQVSLIKRSMKVTSSDLGRRQRLRTRREWNPSSKAGEGRAKFGSMKGKKAKESSSSSTNREKARNKPIMMVMASGAVKSKKRASLKDKQRRLKAHNDKQKKRKS